MAQAVNIPVWPMVSEGTRQISWFQKLILKCVSNLLMRSGPVLDRALSPSKKTNNVQKIFCSYSFCLPPGPLAPAVAPWDVPRNTTTSKHTVPHALQASKKIF